MTDADKLMNPQYFGSDPADIRIRIWINRDSNLGSISVGVRLFGRGLVWAVLALSSSKQNRLPV